MLAPLAAQVIEAANGRQALELARDGAVFQVAIVDLIMPELDGLETIRNLRRMRPGLGIVAMSGALPGQLELAGHLGSDAVIAKPIVEAELLAIMRRLLQRGSAPGPGESH